MSEGKLTPLLLLLLLGSQLVTAQLQDRIQRFLREPPDQTAKVSAKRRECQITELGAESRNVR
jgi:hypothetical protein